MESRGVHPVLGNGDRGALTHCGTRVPLKKIPKIPKGTRVLKATPQVTFLERGHTNL